MFDNVNVHQKRRHQTKTNKNQQLNLVQLFAVEDRVNLEELPNDEPILSDITALSQDTWWLPVREQICMQQELQVSFYNISCTDSDVLVKLL